MRRIGLVGVGPHMVENLVPALRTLPGCEITTVAARRPERAEQFAREWGVPRHSGSYEQLLREPLDLVVVAASPQVHAEVAAAAVAAGTPVFVEKPPAPDLAGVQRLAQLSAANAVPVDVGYNFRFAGAVEQLRRTAAELGTVRHARIAIRARKPTTAIWGLPSAFAGFTYAVGIHAVELACDLFGAPNAVDAIVTRVADRRLHAAALLRFADGRSCELSMSSAATRFGFDVDFVADDGWARCTNLSDLAWARYDSRGAPPKVESSLTTSGLLGGFFRSGYAELLDRCLTQTPEARRTGIAHSLPVYEVIEQMLRQEPGSWSGGVDE